MNKYINDFTQTVQTYYKDLKKYHPISKNEEIQLIRKAKLNNIHAQNKLVTANLKFVFDVAKKYKGQGVAIEDLISEGNLGLIKAINKFDEKKDVKFISYAVWWIRQSIQECLKKKQLSSSVEILNHDILNQNSDEIEEENNLENQYNSGLVDNKDMVQQEAIKDKIINKLLSKLDNRSQFILKSYYGFDQKAMTLDAIGKKLNLSRERVRKIKEKNLRILRSELLLFDDFKELV